MIVLVSVIVLLQSRSFPPEQGFEVFLLSLYEMNVYLIPLLSLFLASFSIMQEKENKTLMMLVTKKESYGSFLLKKSIAVQAVTLLVVIGWYFVFALPMKIFLVFHVAAFLAFLLATLVLLLVFNQIGVFLGSVCSTRMQLVGANIFTWFFLVFLLDLGFLYSLPSVSYDNVKVFSLFYFLDPLHTLHFYLETALGLFPLDHLSRLMQKMVWLAPAKFLLLDFVIWSALAFGLAVGLRSRGERA